MQAELLMCAPTHYDVDYVINPWMEGNLHQASKSLACKQWSDLHAELASRTSVQLVEGAPGWPDMVFTANAGLKCGNRIALSRFRFEERQGEAAHFANWFKEADLLVREMPQGMFFEGEGDALFAVDGNRLWAGWGFRTALESHSLLAEWLDREVSSLRLVDSRFYHLDTCFAPLPHGEVLYFPAAFDAQSKQAIETYYSAEKRIEVSEQDANQFACNIVCLDRTLVMNHISPDLKRLLTSHGYEVIELDLSEFLKAGGAAKCLVMTL